MALTLIVGLFTSRIVLRTLGFEDYGIYNVVSSVIVFFSFLQHALRNATSRYITYSIGEGNTIKLSNIYSMAINSHIILAAILFLFIELGGVWFLNHRLEIPQDRLHAANWAFQLCLINFCVSIIKTPWESNIVAHEKFNFYALVSVVNVTLNLVAVCILIYSPVDKLITYSFLLSLNTVLVFLAYVLYCKNKFPDCKYIASWDFKLLKEFSSYSGWSLLVNLACGISSQSISIFFNIFVGVLANAALGVANQVVSHLNSFVTSFTQAFNPQIIKSYASGHDEYFQKLIFTTSKFSYILMLLVCLPACINIKYILSIWLGEYPPLAPSFICATIAYYMIEAIQTPFVHAVHATGNLKVHQVVVSIIRILAVPITYYALRAGYAPVYAIVIWTFSNFTAGIFRTIYMKSLIGLQLGDYCKNVLLRLLLLTLLSFPLPFLLARMITVPVLSLLASSMTSVVIVLLFSLLLAFDHREREFIFSLPIVKRIIKIKE